MRDGFIEKVGKTEVLPTQADEILDLTRTYCFTWPDQYPSPFLPDLDQGSPGCTKFKLIQLA